jgi:hypothetical protein
MKQSCRLFNCTHDSPAGLEQTRPEPLREPAFDIDIKTKEIEV